LNAYSPPDDNDRRWSRNYRNKQIAEVVQAGVSLDAAIATMDVTGTLRCEFYPDLTAAEAKTDFLAWVQEQVKQAAADVEDAQRDAAKVAELRSLISR
jgi:hypothetical protein